MLHKSGAINFNSDATRYLNDLKDRLLDNYGQAAGSIKIYITFNPALNAFATINKNIYFNVGLLARVKNEAQLAFIMCHEIMHIIENHSVEQFREMKKEVESVGSSDVARKADQVELIRHTMSQKHEFEADKYGLHLYLTAGYEAKHAYDAMKLLKEADEELEQKKVSKEIMGLSEEKFDSLLTAVRNKDLGKDVLLDNDKNEKKKNESDDDDASLSTHPDVDERLVEIEKIIKEFEKTHKGKAAYLVNEQIFNRLKAASLNIVNTSQNQSSDFVSAFLINSGKLVDGKNVTKNDYEQLAYSVFGIIHDRKYKMRYGFNEFMSHEDSVFNLFYRQSDVKGITLWGLDVLQSHRKPNNAEMIDDYMTRIIQMVGTSKEMKEALDPYSKSLTINEFKDSSLRFSEIDFKFSMSNYLSNKEKREFNKKEKIDKKMHGRIAFLDMNNIVIDINSRGAALNLRKSDRLDEMNVEVFKKLKQESENDLFLIIPNASNYNGKQYTTYSMLLNWISERIYFDQTPYKSLYDNKVKEFCQENGVRYMMLGINLGMRRKQGFAISLPRTIGVYLNPIYLPMAYASRRMEQTRNYQLTIMFDLETGDLVFWDKRTSVEPINESFMYNTYDDILQNFRK
jgi:hypothetical protein